MAELDQRACTRRLAHLALLLRRASVPRSPTHALCDDELAARRELALCLAPCAQALGRRAAQRAGTYLVHEPGATSAATCKTSAG